MELNKQIDFSVITKKKWTQSQFFKIFCYIMLGGICLFLLSLLLLGVERWEYLFFVFRNPGDYFMDFFNPVYSAQFKEIYNSWFYADYPALSYIIFNLFSFFIPANVMEISAQYIRGNIYGIISIIAFYTVFIVSFFVVIFKNKIGVLKEKLLFCFFMLFSAPFLFSIERGNIIFAALFFTTFFVFYYDSPKRYLREISLFMLACAVAMKIYPAAIGILLLKDKRYKDILKLGIYSICLFVLPFFYYNGLEDIQYFIDHISQTSGKHMREGYGYRVDMYTTFNMIVYASVQQEYNFLNIIFRYISYLALLLGAFAAYFVDKKWKTVTIACLLMVLIPAFSGTYTLLFLIPPFVLFLNEKGERNFRDLVYLVLFCMVFMLNFASAMPMFMPSGGAVLVDNFCARMSCLIMFIMLCYDGIKDYKRIKYGIK